MKKCCLLLVLLLLLTSCGQVANVPKPDTPQTPPSQAVTVDIYAINDLHGKLTDTAAQPGVDELSAYLRQAQQTSNTLLLATGDMWQGAAESNLTGGLIVTEWMNELGFAAMTIGGHEYDWGEDQIRRNHSQAKFPFLGINIYDRATDQRVDYCQSSVVVEVEGVQIGIIGAIGDCYYSISPEHTKDVYFKTGDALTDLVKAESEKLRAEGVDCIIYTLHDGYDQSATDGTISDADLKSYYDIALSDGYVDLVFEADTHFRYTLMDRHGIYHLQAGGNNSGISYAKVVIDATANEVVVSTAQRIPSTTYSDGEDDPLLQQLLDKYREQITDANRIVGHNRWYRTKDNLSQLAAYVYATAGVEKWGDNYDIVLGGGYLTCRSPWHLPAGEVSYSQLLTLFPFDNPITLCRIRGEDLIERFLETDNENYYIKTTAYYEEIRNDIDPNALYYVVTDTYTSDYTYNHLTVVDTYSDHVFARDLLAEYIANGGLS